MNQIPLNICPKLNRNFSSLVLDVPKIEPDDWERWWAWWNENSKIMTKIEENHNPGQYSREFSMANRWQGVQIYGNSNKEVGSHNFDPWDIQSVDCTKEFPKMFEQIFSLPIDIQRIRAVTSLSNFLPHRDYVFPGISCRISLFDNNPKPTFVYTKFNDKKREPYSQKLPDTSNVWIYPDHTQEHQTAYFPGYSKILLMVLGRWREQELNELIERSVEKYPEYYIE